MLKKSLIASILLTIPYIAFTQEEVKSAGTADLGFGESKCEKIESPYCERRVLSYKLYEQPDEKSKSVGNIKFVHSYTDKNDRIIPPSLEWLKPDGKIVTFEADYSVDGRHTFVGCHGDWYQLPRNPFPAPVWTRLNIKPCTPPHTIGGTLKKDIHGVEVGTNRKVILPAGKIINVQYRDGKLIAIEHYSINDISDDDPLIEKALEEKPKGSFEYSGGRGEFIEDKKKEILNDYYLRGKYKGQFEIHLKDILDEDSHLLFQKTEKDEPQMETKYLDEEMKGKDTQPKK